MARPKAGTEAGKRASEKWRKTMHEKYGANFHKIMQAQGAKGGRKSKGGGFLNREFASKMGSIGGLLAKRGPSYRAKWRECGAEALAMYDSGEYSMADIARKFGTPYSSFRYYLKKRENNGKD